MEKDENSNKNAFAANTIEFLFASNRLAGCRIVVDVQKKATHERLEITRGQEFLLSVSHFLHHLTTNSHAPEKQLTTAINNIIINFHPTLCQQ